MVCSFSKEFSKSSWTLVENSFITEYLPTSNENAVKVYLYGLYLCNQKDKDVCLSDMAKTLSLDEKTVIDCFNYWEEIGLVSILATEPLNVQYLPINAHISSKPKKYKAEKYTDFTKGLQVLLPNRDNLNEYRAYFEIMETYSIKPEAMLMIVKYCVDRKGNDIGYHYISKVAKDFGLREINTAEKVEQELSSYILRTGEIAKILKAMSITRQPDIEDLQLFKKWTKELNFEVENIIFAASKFKKKNINKLDEFMHKLYTNKCFDKQEIASFIEREEELYNTAIKINQALGVFEQVIETEIDTYVSKWVSYGYISQTLTLIARYLFLSEKKSLSEMDEFIETLRNRGFIDLTSVSDYFEQLKVLEDFIKKLLAVIGLNRRPTPWDKENVNTWKSWNFTEEMILEAGKLACGKNSPIQYMNGILSNWKNNQIFTVEDITKTTGVATQSSQEEYNSEYERRRNIAVSRAQKNNEIAMGIEGVSKILSRLNSIEKDLAFAEIANNEQALSDLELEKKNLTKEIAKLLKTKGLTLKDLSPVYACSKCNDTGYVGTHRCDCFDKIV